MDMVSRNVTGKMDENELKDKELYNSSRGFF